MKRILSLFTEISQESQNQTTLLWNLVSTQNLNFSDVYLVLPFFTVCRCIVCNDLHFLFDGSFVSMMADIVFNSWFQFFRVAEDGPSFNIRHVSHQSRGPSRRSSFTSWTAFCECLWMQGQTSLSRKTTVISVNYEAPISWIMVQLILVVPRKSEK